MAITFTNQRKFLTIANSAIMNNIQTASLFFWFRYEPGGSNQSSQICTQIIGRMYNLTVGVILGTTPQAPSGYVNIKFVFVDSHGTTCSTGTNLAIGVSYPIMLTYTSGKQTLYLPGQTVVFGKLTNPLNAGNWDFEVGGSPPGSPCIYTVGDINSWSGYACTINDYNAIALGDDPATIGVTASARYRWKLLGTSGATPSIGDLGLAEVYAGVYNLSAVTGSGSSVYTNPLSFQPSVQLASMSRVGTGGQSIFLFFETIGSRTATTPIAINTIPSLSVNGVCVGAPTVSLCDGRRPFVVLNVPSGVKINHGDTVSLNAPAFWATTTAGATGTLSSTAVANKSGVSAFGTEALCKTLRMGMNFPHGAVSYYNLYRLQKNQRYCVAAPQEARLDANGTPISGSRYPTVTSLFTTHYGLNNLLDSTKYPGNPGLYAVRWDSPVANNTQIYLTPNSTTTITERKDLANPGDANGNGRVRVFDVQLATNSTSVDLDFLVNFTQASKTYQFSNLDIRAPGDFSYTDGQPVSYAPCNWWDLSSITLDRLHNGLGSARFCDSSPRGYEFEPGHLHNVTDFSWEGCVPWRGCTVTMDQARPYDLRVSPYVYGPPEILPGGSPFTATLAANIDNQTTTLTISDAETAPVIAGLLLKVDNELMGVVSVNGTTVTVYRGAAGTTPDAHSAGSIQVQNRVAVSSLSQLAVGQNQIIELTTATAHGLRSGMPVVQVSGTVPTLAFTDGSQFSNWQAYQFCILVTGPKSFIVKHGPSVGTTGPYILSQSYDISTSSLTLSFPGTGLTHEFLGKFVGQFDDCWLHVNIPVAASDNLTAEIARRVRDNMPAGRRVLVEIGDEPWNYTWPTTPTFQWLSTLSFGGGLSSWPWQVYRTQRAYDTFVKVFNEQGRGGEIWGILNSQSGNPGVTQSILAACKAQHVTMRFVIGVAPYVDPDNSAASIAAYNAATIEQIIDLWIHDLYYSPAGQTPAMAGHRAAIAAYNAATGQNVQLYGYEGGVSTCTPIGAKYQLQRTRDAVYHPNWWVIEQDFYAWLQYQGYARFNIYAYDMVHNGNTNWGVYHGPAQLYGRGDGSDGKADNRLCLATPGLPHTKAATTNQDQKNVSVRGSAFLNWNGALKKT